MEVIKIDGTTKLSDWRKEYDCTFIPGGKIEHNEIYIPSSKIVSGTIHASQIVAGSIPISKIKPTEWRMPRMNNVGKVQIVPGDWPSGNVHTHDHHEAQGPWKEHFVLNDDHVLWSVEIPGVPKEDIVVDTIHREYELIKIRILAPYKRNNTAEAVIANTFLDVPEPGCHVSEAKQIDGVLTFEIQRGQEVTRLEID